jgi:hexosaminidase
VAYRRRTWQARRALARRAAYVLLAALAVVTGSADVDPPVSAGSLSLATAIVPAPASVSPRNEIRFGLTAATRIAAPGEAAGIGEYLAGAIRDSTGLPVRTGGDGDGGITLSLGGSPDLGPEGYTLAISAESVRIAAHAPAGLFHGVQSLRQVVPVAARDGRWELPGGSVTDRPRYGWRGASLDVARHFFGVRDVEKYLDLLALYKVNVLHLHLSDDQGWRIAIRGWPKLTQVGAASAVGGGRGGFYSQDDYTRLVRYAQQRFITNRPRDRHAGAHERGPGLVRRAELRRQGARPVHVHGRRLQLAVRRLGADLRLPR